MSAVRHLNMPRHFPIEMQCAGLANRLCSVVLASSSEVTQEDATVLVDDLEARILYK